MTPTPTCSSILTRDRRHGGDVLVNDVDEPYEEHHPVLMILSSALVWPKLQMSEELTSWEVEEISSATFRRLVFHQRHCFNRLKERMNYLALVIILVFLMWIE